MFHIMWQSDVLEGNIAKKCLEKEKKSSHSLGECTVSQVDHNDRKTALNSHRIGCGSPYLGPNEQNPFANFKKSSPERRKEIWLK